MQTEQKIPKNWIMKTGINTEQQTEEILWYKELAYATIESMLTDLKEQKPCIKYKSNPDYHFQIPKECKTCSGHNKKCFRVRHWDTNRTQALLDITGEPFEAWAGVMGFDMPIIDKMRHQILKEAGK